MTRRCTTTRYRPGRKPRARVQRRLLADPEQFITRFAGIRRPPTFERITLTEIAEEMGVLERVARARLARWEGMGLYPTKHLGRITYDRTTFEYLKQMYQLPHRAPGDSDWLTDYLGGQPDAR